MNVLVIVAIGLFLSSIIVFFINNKNKHLTLKQIIWLSGQNLKKPIFLKSGSDVLLMFSIVALILFFNYPVCIEIAGGIFIIFIQKILILIFQRIVPKSKG